MELEAPPRPPKITELPLPEPRKLELCRKVNSWLLESIKGVIDTIAKIVIERDIELTIGNIVELSLHIPVYMKLHKGMNREMEICIKYIDKTESFYVYFPVLGESVLIRGSYRESSDEIMV
jgi:hypothetical protein